MEDELFIGVLAGFVGFIMGMLLFGGILMGNQELHFKEEAINNGCAEYVVDSRGNTEFEWLDHNCKKKD